MIGAKAVPILLAAPFSFILMLLFEPCAALADALGSNLDTFPALMLLLWLLAAAAVTLSVCRLALRCDKRAFWSANSISLLLSVGLEQLASNLSPTWNEGFMGSGTLIVCGIFIALLAAQHITAACGKRSSN